MKARTLDGRIIDSSELTDIQSLLLEKIGGLNVDDIQKNGGYYFLWGSIPQGNRVICKRFLPDDRSYNLLLQSLNQLVNEISGGTKEVVVRDKLDS